MTMTLILAGAGALVAGAIALLLFALWLEEFTRRGDVRRPSDKPPHFV